MRSFPQTIACASLVLLAGNIPAAVAERSPAQNSRPDWQGGTELGELNAPEVIRPAPGVDLGAAKRPPDVGSSMPVIVPEPEIDRDPALARMCRFKLRCPSP